MIKKLIKSIQQQYKYYFQNNFKINFPYAEYSFIVGTKAGLFLTKPDKYIKILSGQFYGLTKYNNYWFLYEAITGLNVGKILRLSNDGSIKVVMKGLSVGCHQIDYFCGNIFITDTYNNCIIKVDPDTMDIISKFYPIGGLDNGRESLNYAHMNSIFYNDGNIYIVCHNETVKTGKNSTILKCNKNFDFIEEIGTDAGNAHNVVVYKNEIVYCDSSSNRVSNSNGETLAQCKNFTRGMSINEDFVVVGESEYSTRSYRHMKGGWINYFDHYWKLKEQQKIPGMVQEIRSVNKIDFCMSSS